MTWLPAFEVDPNTGKLYTAVDVDDADSRFMSRSDLPPVGALVVIYFTEFESLQNTQGLSFEDIGQATLARVVSVEPSRYRDNSFVLEFEREESYVLRS